MEPRSRGYKKIPSQLSVKLTMLINVDNLTFINMINTTSGNLKASIVFIFQHFSFYEQLKFDAHLG